LNGAFLAWRRLHTIRGREQFEKQRNLSAAKPARCEQENYDVSEFKNKWFE
jgi:hypothetical protein